jgi:hypothetical protein
MTADIDVPRGGAEGVIVGEGGRFYGWARYLVNSKPVFTYNLLDPKWTRLAGNGGLGPRQAYDRIRFQVPRLGEATLAYNNTSGVGSGGTGTLKVDGRVVSTQTLEHTLPLVKPLDQTFNIGSAGASPVDDKDYKVPFKFTGTINKLTIALDPPILTPERHKEAGECQPLRVGLAGTAA